MLRGLFARRGEARPGADRADAARVKAWTRAILDLPEDAEVTASEIDCADPSCPGLETVILVMRPGRRSQAVKLACGLADVTEPELRSRLVEAIGGTER